MKKILFLHGFASSGHSGTVMTLRQLLYADGVSVIAPDLPVMPQAAMTLIAQIIEEEKPDVVVTSSMGGLFGRYSSGAHQSCMVYVTSSYLWRDGTS